MKPPRPEPLFLARETYRRRRIMDAARVLPFVAAFLFIAPVLWAGAADTRGGILYLFGVWTILIACSALISRTLARGPEPRVDETIDPGDRGAP